MNTIQYQLSPRTKRLLWRRIFYSYLISTLARPAFVQGFLFGVCVQLLRELVFIKMVIKNFLAVEVGQAPMYLCRLFATAESIKVILVFLVCLSLTLFILSIFRTTRLTFCDLQRG